MLPPQNPDDVLMLLCVFIATSPPLFTKQSQTSVSAANSKLIRNMQLQSRLPKGSSFLINAPYCKAHPTGRLITNVSTEKLNRGVIMKGVAPLMISL